MIRERERGFYLEGWAWLMTDDYLASPEGKAFAKLVVSKQDESFLDTVKSITCRSMPPDSNHHFVEGTTTFDDVMAVVQYFRKKTKVMLRRQ
jgi:hypothetical protein